MDERIARLMAVIRAEAGARNISIKALAREAEVSYPAMRRYLNGERPMSLSLLYRVADLLDSDVDDLVVESARTDPLAEGRIIRGRFGHQSSEVDDSHADDRAAERVANAALAAHILDRTGDQHAVTDAMDRIAHSAASDHDVSPNTMSNKPNKRRRGHSGGTA